MSQTSSDDPRHEPIPAHAPLTGYWSEEKQRQGYVVDLFDKTARYYNTIEMLFGNGGLWYRRFSLKRAGLGPGMRVLDVAIGTAAVSRGAVKLVGPTGEVYGVDPSRGMMAEARKNFDGPLTQGLAGSLPFATDSFDFVTMGIALRHVGDLVATFSEYCRVLKPGGKVWILEAHVPKSRAGLSATRFVWAKLIPALTLVSTRDRDAKLLMDFYWDTVEFGATPDDILAAMERGGFENPRYEVIVPDAFCEYTATKPAR